MESRVTNLLVLLFVSLVIFTSIITVKNYVIDGEISAKVKEYERITKELEKSLDQVEKEKLEQNNQPTQNPTP